MSKQTIRTAELRLGHRYLIPRAIGGPAYDGAYEGAWDGMHHFAGTGATPDFAFPTEIDSVEGEDLGPASVLDTPLT